MKWAVISFSTESSIELASPALAGGFFTIKSTGRPREATVINLDAEKYFCQGLVFGIYP